MKEQILEALMAEPLEKEASDQEGYQEYIEKAAEEFGMMAVELGLDKEAGFMDSLRSSGAIKNIASGFGSGIGSGIAGLGIGAMGVLGSIAARKALSATGNAAGRSRYEQALSQALSRNQILRGLEGEQLARIKSFGDSIFRVAPTVAQDVNTLSNVLAHYVDSESLDLHTMKTLADLEEKFSKNNPSAASMIR